MAKRSFYITKYALSSGVTIETLDHEKGSSYAWYCSPKHGGLKVGRDCFPKTPSGLTQAVEAVEQMRLAKIKSLSTSLTKLQGLNASALVHKAK